ncbi:MAG: DNA polymerase/3'-5' exonuclease PolX [Balneola sp.]|nr:DNA polymerase/3'-5' exonuclease PolX [Balneola sp.]
MPTIRDIADQLDLVYQLMQLAGENRFKAIAFDRASQTIRGFEEDINKYIEEKCLTNIKGIGKSIANDIYAYAETGEMPVLEKFKEKVPVGLIQWLDISGLGPKNILKIHQQFGISTLDELKKCIDRGDLAELPGLGAKSVEKIKKSLAWMEQFEERCRLNEADDIAKELVQSLKNLPGVESIKVAGSLRRSKETIGDIDILIAAEEAHIDQIFDAFTSHECVVEILGRGETKSSVRSREGRQIDLRLVHPASFGAALMYFTGSKEHNIAMRFRARERGLALNEYGLFKLNSKGETDWEAKIRSEKESSIYKDLGLHWIPPELREDRGELEWFAEHEQMPLVQKEQIRGVIHTHSTWSDGKYSIQEMAAACIARDYEYLGITDHSKTAGYAGGLSIDRVKAQWREIEKLNAQYAAEGVNFVIFKGIESDILGNGDLDYPTDILAGFDFIVASVHQQLDMPYDAMMDRFKRAIENPFTTMIGHPTGRLLLKRGESSLDMNVLIEYAAQQQTAIEINASPWRLDLDWTWGNKAKQAGLYTSINPDAHSIEGIDDIHYGVRIARKAKFDQARVLNSLSADDFLSWAKKSRNSKL